MKICLVHHEYPEETSMGGIATYQKLLAMELTKLGNKVTVIAAAKDIDKEYMEDGIHIIRFNKCIQYDTIDYMTAYRNRVADKLHELYLNNEIDIIESPEMGAECLAYLNKYHDVPVVCKLHTSFEIWAEFNETTLPPEVHSTLVNWEREYIEKSDFVTSCTNLLYSMMQERKQISRKDVLVLGNPANIAKFKDLNSKKENSVLYLGGLEQRKGVLVLAKSIPLVLAKYPDLKFKFIGADTTSNDKNILTSEYIKEIIPKKFHSNLEFIGHIENSEVNKYCNVCMMGVIPSKFDNLPYVAMEEILSGLPIIASDNTGVKEMITNNVSGYLFENGNYHDLAWKIIDLYENKDKREQFSKLGKDEIIKKFSPSKIALQTLNVYQDALNRFAIKKEFKNVKNIQKIPFGVANFVYKIKLKDTIKIIKSYRPETFPKIIISPFIYNNNEFKEVNQEIINNSLLIDYIKGKHKKDLNSKELEIIIKFINFYQNYLLKDSNKLAKLEEKLNKYKETKYIKYANIIKDLENIWQENSSNITKILTDNLVPCHGDISKTNIIFNNDSIGFIDMDETCLAPKLYDIAVLIVKFCFSNNNLDKLSKEIIEIYEKNNKMSINKQELALTILIYLYKIIIEKIYWAEQDLLDLEDDTQKEDYYLDYYNLLKKVSHYLNIII